MGMKPECVITGMGLVLPCGEGIAAARASWESQQPCFRSLPAHLGTGLGGVCEVATAGIIPPIQNRRLDRVSRFAWVATHHAFLDAGLDPKERGDHIGLAVGSVTGGVEASEQFLQPYLAEGPAGASPLIFPNSVAVAISGHLSIAFGLRGCSTTQLAREACFFSALDQAQRWLTLGMVEIMLVVGADGLSPLFVELLQGNRLCARHGLPEVGSRRGLLPGEGAQAFIVETREHAQARGARIRGTILGLASCAPLTQDLGARSLALAEAATSITPAKPAVWISGANGHPLLDDVEQHLLTQQDHWPRPRYPKTLWGEFAGSGGQLLAAALLTPAATALITAPASLGGQWSGVVLSQ
jgi:3-oxoacyl-[acyl-carrier-protein] synthase II